MTLVADPYIFFPHLLQLPPNDLRVKPFNPKVYAQIYKNAGRTYGKYIKKAQDDVDYWKKKYESWRWKIPKARQLNYQHGIALHKHCDEKRAAQKEAREAEERATAATAQAEELKGQLKHLRENLESKLEALGLSHGHAVLQSSLYSWDYGRVDRAIQEGNEYVSPDKQILQDAEPPYKATVQ